MTITSDNVEALHERVERALAAIAPHLQHMSDEDLDLLNQFQCEYRDRFRVALMSPERYGLQHAVRACLLTGATALIQASLWLKEESQ